MILHLLENLAGRSAVLAMLCKTTVARKVLKYVWRQRLQVDSSAIYSIDASEHFGASVDACLLVCELKPGKTSQECSVYDNLDAREPQSVIGFQNGRLIADQERFKSLKKLFGRPHMKWRSGIKHDCARVMELSINAAGNYENGLGEAIELEPTYVFPMLKSSQLMKEDPSPTRFLLVTQQSVKQDTAKIEFEAPKTWRYLERHAEYLDKRSSSIYRNRPKYSIFGVGPYSFTQWKVAISGFYKQLHFCVVGPHDGKPVVLDDTSYFLPCQSEREARIICELLRSDVVGDFLGSLAFWDAKRPVTAELLGSLDLIAASKILGVDLPNREQKSSAYPLLDELG